MYVYMSIHTHTYTLRVRYDLDMYHGSVATYPFYDHNPPAMELLLPVCTHMHQYLQADPNNCLLYTSRAHET